MLACMKKRMIAVLTAVAVMLCMMPFMAGSAYADDEYVPKGKAYPAVNGNYYFDKETGTITSCEQTVTELNIPAQIEGVKVTAIDDYAIIWNNNLVKVTIPDTVTTIGYAAFFRCDSIKELNLSKNVTKLAGNPFGGCTALEKVNVASDNPVYTSVNGVVYSKDKTKLIAHPCSNEKSCVIPKGVKTIGKEAFYQNFYLEGVTIPDTVKSIEEYAFDTCGTLKKLVIPDSVQTIGLYAFAGCDDLNTVTIGKGVKVIGNNAFTNCDSLKKLVIPEGVTEIGTLYHLRVGDLYLPASLKKIDEEMIDEYCLSVIHVKKGSYAESFCKSHFPDNDYVVTPVPELKGLKYASGTTSSVTVKWKAAQGATAYEVYKSGKKYKTVTGTKCTVKGLKTGSSYKIKVRPVNPGEYVQGAIKSVTVPVKPGKAKLTKVSAGKKCLTAKWSKKKGSGYQVAVSKNKKFSKSKKIKVTSSKTLSKKVTKLTKGSRYYVKVRAYKKAGGKTVYGSWSDVKRTGKIK